MGATEEMIEEQNSKNEKIVTEHECDCETKDSCEDVVTEHECDCESKDSCEGDNCDSNLKEEE